MPNEKQDAMSARLRELNLRLPEAAAPVAAYVPWMRSGALVFISGQLPLEGGKLRHKGKLGAELDVEEGFAAARLCALNVLAQLREACGGDFSGVRRCVRLGGFVNGTAEFDKHPAVVNGASELIQEVMGESGRHARVAVGVANLPFNAAVEVEALFEVAPEEGSS